MTKGKNPRFQAYVWDIMEKLPPDVQLVKLATMCGCSQGLLTKCLTNMVKKNMLDTRRQSIWQIRLSIDSPDINTQNSPPERTLEEIPTYVTRAIYGKRAFRGGMTPVSLRIDAINAFIHAEGSTLGACMISNVSAKVMHIVYDDWDYIPRDHYGRLSVHSWKARKYLKKEQLRAERKAEKATAELKAAPPIPGGNALTEATMQSIARREIEEALAFHVQYSVHQPVSTNGTAPGGIMRALTSPFRFVGRRVMAVGRAVVRG